MTLVRYVAITMVALTLLAACAPAPAPVPPTQVPVVVPTAVPAAPTAIPAAPTAAPVPQTGANAPKAAAISVANNAEYGKIVTDAAGMTLYMYTKDTNSPSVSNCYDACAQKWPPVLADASGSFNVQGSDLDAKLFGTTERKDGTKQVTFNGWPLYYWVNDKNAGDTTGQNVGGVWFVMSTKGDIVKEKAPSSSAAPQPGAVTSKAPAIAIADNAKFGKIVADAAGMTLYMYTKDTNNPSVSNCYDACAAKWPPVFADANGMYNLQSATLDSMLFGTTTRKDGAKQVTFNGWPLYYWVNDKVAGDTTGQGVGGVWWVLKTDGTPITAPAPAAPAPTSSPYSGYK